MHHNRLLLLLILTIQSLSASNDNQSEVHALNELPYSHESRVSGQKADFTFEISNTTYATEVLHLQSYYFGITFIGEERHEYRTASDNIYDNVTVHHGVLRMTNLEEEEGSYVVCVFFQNTSGHLVGSSRFCHVVSIKDRCKLEAPLTTFRNRQIFVLLPFVALIFIVAVVFSCIRDYVYRPRTIEALLKTLPEHHAENLESLAPVADNRRRRRTEGALNKRLREDSVLTVDYDPAADHQYFNYHGIDNASLDIITE